MDIVESMAEVFVPYQLEADAFAATQLGAQDDPELPRFAGATALPVFGVRERKGVQIYSVWRHQQTADRYAALDDADKTAVDTLLSGSKWLEYLQTRPALRIKKAGSNLVLAR